MELNDKFIEQIRALLPESEAGQLIGALSQPAETSVRINRHKPHAAAKGESVPWCAGGFYLQERPQFTFDPMLHGGLYYVQDASSMFISHAIKHIADREPVRYLDLCAAPGGKTTAAIDALADGSLVVANEIDSRRAQILKENIIKWGVPNCIVTNDNSAKLGKLTGFFDIIAADMPCSGEGMFRKDEEAVAQWNPGLVEQCANRQREIADNIWNALKPGGYMVYSTCTFNHRENEEIIDYLIDSYGAESVEIPIDESWRIKPGIGTAAHCYRFMPHSTKGEGLFMSVLRKPEDTTSRIKIKPAKQQKNAAPKECAKFLNATDGIAIGMVGETACALPTDRADEMRFLAGQTHAIMVGTPIATVKGKTVVPEHAVSQSVLLDGDAFASVELDYAGALAYLRGETSALDSSIPKGYVVARYKGIALGWMKNIGNRANNMYPKEYRIRTTYTPDTPPRVLD